MTDATTAARPAAWPLPLMMSRHNERGVQAQGFVLALSDLPALARRMARRARHYAGLRLTLCATEAVFWSTQSADLPWLPVHVTYLHPPSNRIFLPIGWAHNVPDRFFSSLLSDVLSERDSGTMQAETPLLLLPLSPAWQSSPVRIVDLAGSLSVAAVDWALLSRGRP